jgi:hypothetical protein
MESAHEALHARFCQAEVNDVGELPVVDDGEGRADFEERLIRFYFHKQMTYEEMRAMIKAVHGLEIS